MDVVLFVLIVVGLCYLFGRYWIIPSWHRGYERGQRKSAEKRRKQP